MSGRAGLGVAFRRRGRNASSRRATGLAVALGSVLAASTAAQDPEVLLTWLGNSAWVVQAGETTLLLDPAISRPEGRPPDPADPSTLLWPPSVPDEAAVRRAYGALRLADGVDVILVGHAHADHAFDTALWSRLTGARVVGSRSACLQAYAQGVAESDCRSVEGGEVLELGPRLSARVVRWHHSGNRSSPLGRLIQTPLELRAAPSTDPVTGGLSPSGVVDFPNGGGSRAFLFSYGEPGAELRWLVSDTGNPAAWDVPATGEEAWFTELGIPFDNLEITEEVVSTREHLTEALAAGDVERVDLWVGYWDPAHVAQVVPLLAPGAFVPNHWIGAASLFDGLPRPFANERLSRFLDEAGVQLLAPRQFAARYRLTSAGVIVEPSEGLRARLGIGR